MPRDASCLSVVNYNSTKRWAQSFCRASVYWRARFIQQSCQSVRPSVCLSVRPWRSSILWKPLNYCHSFFTTRSPIILVLLVLNIFAKFRPYGGAKYQWRAIEIWINGHSQSMKCDGGDVFIPVQSRYVPWCLVALDTWHSVVQSEDIILHPAWNLTCMCTYNVVSSFIAGVASNMLFTIGALGDWRRSSTANWK